MSSKEIIELIKDNWTICTEQGVDKISITAQRIDGMWCHPKWSCDTMQNIIDRIRKGDV